MCSPNRELYIQNNNINNNININNENNINENKLE